MSGIWPSWTERIASTSHDVINSRRAQLAATAVLSGSVVASCILGYQRYARQQDLRELKSSIPSQLQKPIHNDITTKGTAPQPNGVASIRQYPVSTGPPVSKEDERSAALAARARSGDYDDDLILEQLARNRVFLKDDGLAKLRASFIVIVGCGGVGSHAAAALARSGVSKIRLIDFDQVTLSSLNRHALATLADVGTPKVHCVQRRIEQIAPWVRFDCQNELFSKQAAREQLKAWDSQLPTYVIDAIDNIDSKVDLLKYCYDNKLPVISSMGAGCKSDPTRIFIGDISTSAEDPLSKSTRRRLRLQGVSSGIPVVFSAEKASPDKAALLPLPDEEFQKGNVGDLSVMPDFRVRILPVLGTMPAMFGLCVANHVMLTISGYPYEYMTFKGREKMYDAMLSSLQSFEERLARFYGDDAQGLRIAISHDDVSYLAEEVYRSKSVISGLPTRLVLIRWMPPRHRDEFINRDYPGQKYTNLKLSDCVVMTKDEASKHQKQVLQAGRNPAEVYSPDIVKHIQARQAEEALFSQYRG